MDIFISYSSKYRELCERLQLSLDAEGHRCFVDRTELEPGHPFDAELREAIADCDVFIFLVSPESVAAGSYALAELNLAQQRWRHPRGRVLPVVVAPTPMASIPPYLKAVTLLQPQGEVVAETLAAVTQMGNRGPRPLLLTVIGLAVVAAMGAGAFAYVWQQRAAERTQQEQTARETASATELCMSGSHAAAWNRFDELVARYPSDAAVHRAREHCGMRWLREIRVRVGEQTFADIVKRVQPVLVAALPNATGQRAADLFAHLGWADYLLTREGATAGDPAAQFQRSIKEEPDNVYAHAMWGQHLWWFRDRDAEARQHFERAVASGREREFVRSLQFGGSLSRAELVPYAVIVANDMRLAGEAMNDPIRNRLWSMAYRSYLFSIDNLDTRSSFLAILPPDTHLATFNWLFPRSAMRSGDIPVWRYVHAVLLANAGQTAQARAELEALLRELNADKVDGRIVDQTRRTLAELSPALKRSTSR
jgi:TIR domain